MAYEFQQELGLDLRDVYRPNGGRSRLTPRLVLALVEQLPEGGPVFAARMVDAPPPDPSTVAALSWRGWTYDRFLATSINDQLAAANWQRGGGQGRRPDPGPTPRVTPKAITMRDRMREATSKQRGG